MEGFTCLACLSLLPFACLHTTAEQMSSPSWPLETLSSCISWKTPSWFSFHHCDCHHDKTQLGASHS